MEKIIAACGLDCTVCAAFIAAKNNDTVLRKKTAAEWSGMYSFSFTADMINCHGCHATDGVLIGHCSVCEMRLCSIKKGLENCGMCETYPCKAIGEFQNACPETKTTLDALRGR